MRNGRGMAKSRYYFIQTSIGESICEKPNQNEIFPKETDPKCCHEICKIIASYVESNQRIILDSDIFKTSECKGTSIRCNDFSYFPVSQEKLRAVYKNHEEMLDESQIFSAMSPPLTIHNILKAPPSTDEGVGNGNTEETPSQVSASVPGLRGLSLISTTQILSAAPPISSVPTSIESQRISTNFTSFPTIEAQDANETLDDSLKEWQVDDGTHWDPTGREIVVVSVLAGLSITCVCCSYMSLLKQLIENSLSV